MIKIFLAILVVYVIYYSGMIFYDLFLKKEKSIDENVEEYEIPNLSSYDTEKIKDVGIEDVESLKTPNSFSKKDAISNSKITENERQNIWKLKQKYDEENQLEFHDMNNKSEEEMHSKVQKNSTSAESTEIAKGESNRSEVSLQELMSIATSHVQLVANYNGQIVYQSTLQF